LNSQLLEAQEHVSSLRALLEDEKSTLGRTENEVLRLEERVAGLMETSKQQDTALLDARRDAQASREREAMVNGQMLQLQLQLQRDRDVDVELITRLRLEVGTAATRVSQSEAEANAYKGQLAQLNDRVGGLLSSVGPGGSHE
jgi:chromosome segregation ATPase